MGTREDGADFEDGGGTKCAWAEGTEVDFWERRSSTASGEEGLDGLDRD